MIEGAFHAGGNRDSSAMAPAGASYFQQFRQADELLVRHADRFTPIPDSQQWRQLQAVDLSSLARCDLAIESRAPCSV